MQYDKALFETMPIPKAVAKNSIPAIMSMLLVFVYNVADTFFIGQTGDELQVAAVTLSMPIFTLLIGAGVLLGVGSTSVISRALGAGRERYAKNVSSFAFYGAIGFGLLLMVLFWTFMPIVLKVIGVTPDTYDYTRAYLNYLVVGAPFVILSQAFSNIIRAEGRSSLAMRGMMLGSIANIILDPIFIFTFDMGLTGAAVATVLGNILSALYFIRYLVSGRSILSINLKDFKVTDGIMLGVLAIGIPASLNNLLLSVANIFMNNFLSSYGDIQLAAMGVAIRANMILVFVQIGLGQGIQPLIGYCYGARNFDRLRGIIKFSSIAAICLGSVLTLIYWVLTDTIIGSFIDNEQVVAYGTQMLRALIISGPIVGIMFIFINVLQGLGKAIPSLILSISRHGLVFIPLIYLLNRIAGLNGVVYTQPITDIVTSIIGVSIYLAVMRGVKRSYGTQQRQAGT